MNADGKLLTKDADIRDEAVKHYKNVFKPRVEDIKDLKDRLCKARLESTSKSITPPWTVEDVTFVLKQLKKGKSKDPYNLPNELFQPNVAGDDFILAITKLMNRIKSELIYPKPMNICNVTNLYKNKGLKQNFDSYRGIFRTPVLRNILDKLIYIDEYQNINQNLTNCNVGSRKGRNIRDNLFVIGAIMNQSKQNPAEAADIGVYDIHKCFDSLWLKECINDLYDSGLRNDKLNLICLSNQAANIALKTTSGITDSFSIEEMIMQGTVWSGLMCTSTMDKLCKTIYKEKEMLFKYRGIVEVPPLEMVDDVVTVSLCGENSMNLNSAVNSFVEHKKLKLSETKCANIHVGNKETKDQCPNKKIGDNIMNESEREKYLGDYLTSKANSKYTLESRKSRGYAILGEISAMLRDVPMGNQRTKIGLELRKSWFQNCCLFNSETWNGISDSDLKDLEVIDHKILRAITGAQSKVPIEMLYIETAQISISHVISVRRLMYWQTIITRHRDELISQVYHAMKDKPLKDDWICLLYKDLEKIGLSINDEEDVSKLSKYDFKTFVKMKMRQLSLSELENMKKGIKKFIVHKNTNEPQECLTSGLFSNSQKIYFSTSEVIVKIILQIIFTKMGKIIFVLTVK